MTIWSSPLPGRGTARFFRAWWRGGLFLDGGRKRHPSTARSGGPPPQTWGGAVGALLLLLASPAIAAKPAPAIELAWPTDTQPRVPIVIKNTPLIARVALGFDKAMLLNGAPAARARLKAFPIIGKRTVRNPLIPGGEAVFRGNIYDVAAAGLPKTGVPTVWVDKPVADDADGVLSALGFNADKVVLARAALPGERVYALTRKGGGDALIKAQFGGETVNIGLDLRSPDTVMNARAAVALEAAGLVKRSGIVAFWMPFPAVSLPIERLTPVPGATLLGLPLARPAARISEARLQALDARAKAGTSTALDDADTITVTAQRQKKGADPWLLIGRDVLDRCSRIELDRPGKRWLLTCAF